MSDVRDVIESIYRCGIEDEVDYWGSTGGDETAQAEWVQRVVDNFEPRLRAALAATTAERGLDEAWDEVVAALPEGWRFAIDPYYPSGWEAYAYDIHQTPTSGRSDHSTGSVYGDTPAAALRALARLRSESPDSEPGGRS